MKLTPALLCAAVAFGTLVADGSIVAAQDDDSKTVPLARRLFNEGVDAAHRSKWDVAHDRFKRAYELAPRLKTLFNLAGAQMQTDRLVDASESYRRFLRETSDGRYPDYRKDAQRLLTELERRIPFARIRVIGISAKDRLNLDGDPFPTAGLGEPLPLNPGEHSIEVVRSGAIIGKKTFTLSDGDSTSVDLVVEKAIEQPDTPIDQTGKPPVGAMVPPTKDKGDDEGGGVLSSPWFWTAVVVVLAGGGTTAYFLTQDQTSDPTQGTLGRGVIDLTP